MPPGSDVPLEAPAYYVFAAPWRGHETEIWARQIETPNGIRTFFRNGKSEEFGNWLTVTNIFSPEFLQKILAKEGFWNLENSARRQFYLDGAPYGHPGPIELRVGLRRASWRLGQEVVSFYVPNWTLEEFVNLPAAAIGRRAKGWLKESDGAARLALDWTHSSALERQARLLGIALDELVTVKTLMDAAFKIHLRKSVPITDDASIECWKIELRNV